MPSEFKSEVQQAVKALGARRRFSVGTGNAGEFRKTVDAYMARDPAPSEAELTAVLDLRGDTDEEKVAIFLATCIRLQRLAIQQAGSKANDRSTVESETAVCTLFRKFG